MQMRIDETLGHQIAAGIDLGCGGAVETRRDGGDAAVLDADIDVLPVGGAAQTGTADRNVERLCHRKTAAAPIRERRADADARIVA